MLTKRHIRRAIREVGDTLVVMVAGAMVFLLYLRWMHPEWADALRDTYSGLQLFLLLGFALGSSRPTGGLKTSGSPRWSGVGVVLLVGVWAAVFLGDNSSGAYGYFTAGVIVLVTMVAAAAIWRFATVHASEIGEARFVATPDGPRMVRDDRV